MIRCLAIIAGITLSACGQGGQPVGNSLPTENAAVPAAAEKCVAPTLALAGGAQSLESVLMKETQANFDAAYEKFCAENRSADKPLIDPEAVDQDHIFLVNAPEANVASIYLSNVDGSRMMLEYPFLTTDGKSQVPTADELGEAIYCAVRGATPEEQETSGRCLVD